MKKNKKIYSDAASRREEIARLEDEREEINRELDKLLLEYARLTGNRALAKGVRDFEKQPNRIWYFK